MANDIKLIQLNSYVRPKIEENKGQNWVMNGKKNIFYQYIIDRFNGSPTNSAVINSYSDLIYGRGLTSDNEKDVELLQKVISNQEIRKICSDFSLFTMASIQTVNKRDSKNLPNLYHIAQNKVIPEIEDDKGNINGYFFSQDWSKYTEGKNKPIYFPAFGKKAPKTIYCIKPYKAGKKYFSDPDYLAGLPYAEMEEEIANYCINHIQNGLSFGYIINVPDGANWTPDQRQEFERQLKNKLTGSNNAGKFIIAFNGRDMEVNVVPLDVNSAHKQWEFLTQESRQQLLTAHRVTSPMLFGIKDNTGLGNNANELDVAEAQLYKRVIKPKQQFITDAFNEIMAFYNYDTDFYFLPLTDYDTIKDNVNDEKEVIKEKENTQKAPNETQLKKHSSNCGCGCDSVELNATPIQRVIDSMADEFILSGEKEDDLLKEFELIAEDKEQFNIKETQLNTIVELARSPFSTPKKKSEQDTSLFKIRYQYAGAKTGQREFCKKVLKENRVYRWEDLESASQKVVNAGFGLKGADTYDIAKYKGGVNCKHFWQRKIYLRKNNKAIGVNEAKKMILQLEPSERADAKWQQNPKEVAQIAGPSNNFWRVN
jgi:hypothetical protein